MFFKKEKSGSGEYKQAILEARSKISQLKTEKDDTGKQLQQLQLENLSGSKNETEINDCRVRLVDLSEKLEALAAHEKNLKRDYLEALNKEKTVRLEEIQAAIKTLKTEEQVFYVEIVKAHGRLCAVQKYLNGNYQNPGFPAGQREIFYEAIQQAEKELEICDKRPLNAQLTALHVEAEQLKNSEYDKEFLADQLPC